MTGLPLRVLRVPGMCSTLSVSSLFLLLFDSGELPSSADRHQAGTSSFHQQSLKLWPPIGKARQHLPNASWSFESCLSPGKGAEFKLSPLVSQREAKLGLGPRHSAAMVPKWNQMCTEDPEAGVISLFHSNHSDSSGEIQLLTKCSAFQNK